MLNKPFSTEWLPVGEGHTLHVARYGNPEGTPVLFLHGGPGTGCLPSELLLWDLDYWQVIFLDQRGAGLSKSPRNTEHLSFYFLLRDIEYVRRHLGYDAWYMAGGSFGATLGLLYTAVYPERVIDAVFWGMFVPSAAGVNWLYGDMGAALLFPAAYRRFAGIESSDLSQLLNEFTETLHSDDQRVRADALGRWLSWESELAMPANGSNLVYGTRSLSMAKLQLHYAIHDYLDGWALWQRATPLLTSSCCLIQGENDWVCPTTLLRTAIVPWPKSLQLNVVANAHHSLADLPMLKAVCEAIAAWRHPANICRRG